MTANVRNVDPSRRRQNGRSAVFAKVIESAVDSRVSIGRRSVNGIELAGVSMFKNVEVCLEISSSASDMDISFASTAEAEDGLFTATIGEKY